MRVKAQFIQQIPYVVVLSNVFKHLKALSLITHMMKNKKKKNGSLIGNCLKQPGNQFLFCFVAVTESAKKTFEKSTLVRGGCILDRVGVRCEEQISSNQESGPSHQLKTSHNRLDQCRYVLIPKGGSALLMYHCFQSHQLFCT